MLSRPISRAKFVVSYWLGFSIVSLLILTLFSLFMVFFLQYNYDGLSLWVTSMAMEILIMTAFALFASIILRSSVTSVLLCFGFYIVSRMMGFFSYILDKHHSFDLLSFDFYAQKVIWLASYLLPRLDLFGQSKWLTYGIDSITISNFVIPVAQSLIYIPILLIFAIIDFSKKQF
jgi:ABC-type transport system involved in multi-copper enzyme maturation permease subunit